MTAKTVFEINENFLIMASINKKGLKKCFAKFILLLRYNIVTVFTIKTF